MEIKMMRKKWELFVWDGGVKEINKQYLNIKIKIKNSLN